MATKVLRPKDLLVEGFRVHTTSFHRQRIPSANGSVSTLRKQQGDPSPKHDEMNINVPAAEAKISCHGGPTDRWRKGGITGCGLVMGKVTLLRRGDSLNSLTSKIPKSSESQEIVRNKIRALKAAPADIYAGTAFSLSPSSRSVPLPSFFNKENDTTRSKMAQRDF